MTRDSHRPLKITRGAVDVARRVSDRWYVSVGQRAIGPVKLDLLARGVEAGRVPATAFVRHEAWKVWCPIAEIADGDDTPPTSSFDATDDVADAGHAFCPDETREALVLFMTAAVARVAAHAAIVHEVHEAGDLGATVVGAHGPRRGEVLGLVTPPDDAALVAACDGEPLVREEVDDALVASTASRLGLVGGACDGIALFPVCVGGQLVAALEIGRGSAFTGAEIASLEALARALEVKLAGLG